MANLLCGWVPVFMHGYRADLGNGGELLGALLARPDVLYVDMGHTHYNELSNDGGTILMATRSAGQIKEGPSGFSVAAIVGWRFHPLDARWPLVVVTGPADHGLIINPVSPDQLVRNRLRIAAKVWGDRPITWVTASVDDCHAIPLSCGTRDVLVWSAALRDGLVDGVHGLTIIAEDEAGRSGRETIRFLVDGEEGYEVPSRYCEGSDRNAIGAWPEKQLAGMQLGPDRNGRRW